jgi:hypothetical protein
MKTGTAKARTQLSRVAVQHHATVSGAYEGRLYRQQRKIVWEQERAHPSPGQSGRVGDPAELQNKTCTKPTPAKNYEIGVQTDFTSV